MTFQEQISAELASAKVKHKWNNLSVVHQAAILAEESGEAVKAALELYAEKGTSEALKLELIQTAAMAIRMLEELEPNNSFCSDSSIEVVIAAHLNNNIKVSQTDWQIGALPSPEQNQILLYASKQGYFEALYPFSDIGWASKGHTKLYKVGAKIAGKVNWSVITYSQLKNLQND